MSRTSLLLQLQYDAGKFWCIIIFTRSCKILPFEHDWGGVIRGVEVINLIGRGWQSRKNARFPVDRLTLPSSSVKQNSPPLLCVYCAPTHHYSIPHQINTFSHLYSVKNEAKTTLIPSPNAFTMVAGPPIRYFFTGNVLSVDHQKK